MAHSSSGPFAIRDLAVVAWLLPLGCYSGVDAPWPAGLDGEAGGGNESDDDGAGDPDDDAPPVGACGMATAPTARLHRLSRAEYDNTLRDLDLIASGESVADQFVGDAVLGGNKRGFRIGGPVDDALARDLVDAAASVAHAATEDLTRLTGCNPSSASEEDDCARIFISEFGRRVYRRPLQDAEVDELSRVHGDVRDAYDHRAGLEAVLGSMLAAPQFLYLVETDPPQAQAGDVVAVGDYELASRLSYFIWDSMPDEDLLAAAQRGELSSEDELQEQVRRMLDDPRAKRAVHTVLSEWTFVDDLATTGKDAEVFDWYTPELAADLEASLMLSLENAVWGPEPTLHELLGADTMFVNNAIAQAYGLDPVAGADFVEVQVDPTQRRGPLTHPALLALNAKPSRSSPIARGLFVREQLLCNELPEPPDVDANGDPIEFDIPPPDANVSNRERFAQHTENPACAGCHVLLDPIGFGFEAYDAAGRFRAIDDNGLEIDASGEVNGAGDLDGPFDGAPELVDRMIASEAVADCVATQWLRYGLGRLETAEDDCARSTSLEHFVSSGLNMQELIVAVATSDAFRFRQVGEK